MYVYGPEKEANPTKSKGTLIYVHVTTNVVTFYSQKKLCIATFIATYVNKYVATAVYVIVSSYTYVLCVVLWCC